jgi:hypothetical protein
MFHDIHTANTEAILVHRKRKNQKQVRIKGCILWLIDPLSHHVHADVKKGSNNESEKHRANPTRLSAVRFSLKCNTIRYIER